MLGSDGKRYFIRNDLSEWGEEIKVSFELFDTKREAAQEMIKRHEKEIKFWIEEIDYLKEKYNI